MLGNVRSGALMYLQLWEIQRLSLSPGAARLCHKSPVMVHRLLKDVLCASLL